MSSSGLVECKLCGSYFDEITWSHLKWCHGITLDEYQRIFPSADLVGDRLRRWMVVGHLGKAQSEDSNRKRSLTLSGRLFSSDHCRHISEVQIGKPKSEEARRNMSLGHVGWEPDETTRRNMSLRQSRKWKDPEYASMLVRAQHQQPNDAEMTLLGLLLIHFPGYFRLNILLEKPVSVGGKIPDFISTNGRRQVIEIFGEHWHPGDTAEEDKVAHYRRYGYNCLVLWEDEVYQENLVVEKVGRLVKEVEL